MLQECNSDLRAYKPPTAPLHLQHGSACKTGVYLYRKRIAERKKMGYDFDDRLEYSPCVCDFCICDDGNSNVMLA